MDELKEKVGSAQSEVLKLRLEKKRLEDLLQKVRETTFDDIFIVLSNVLFGHYSIAGMV